MGGPMAARLAAMGEVIVFDTRPEAVAPFANIATSAADVAAQADIVFACLTDPDDYRLAVLGPDGLLQGGRMRHYVHLGTSGPPLVVELAQGLARRDIAVLDAPITGGPGRARDGSLTAMVAGPAESLALALPLLRAFASTIVNLGLQPGAAQTMKLINNAISLANLAVASEAMLLGAKVGIPAEAMLAVINHGSGQNSATLTKIPNHTLTRGFDYGGSLHVVIKDLELFVANAGAAGAPSRLTQAVLAAYHAARAEGGPGDDVTTVIRPMERASGVELHATPNT